MRHFLNRTLFVVVEWSVIALALGIATSMTFHGCTSDDPRPVRGFHPS